MTIHHKERGGKERANLWGLGVGRQARRGSRGRPGGPAGRRGLPCGPPGRIPARTDPAQRDAVPRVKEADKSKNKNNTRTLPDRTTTQHNTTQQPKGRGMERIWMVRRRMRRTRRAGVGMGHSNTCPPKRMGASAPASSASGRLVTPVARGHRQRGTSDKSQKKGSGPCSMTPPQRS
jgi:hypothetical protein